MNTKQRSFFPLSFFIQIFTGLVSVAGDSKMIENLVSEEMVNLIKIKKNEIQKSQFFKPKNYL